MSGLGGGEPPGSRGSVLMGRGPGPEPGLTGSRREAYALVGMGLEGRQRGPAVRKTRQGPVPFNQFPFLLPPTGRPPRSDVAGRGRE